MKARVARGRLLAAAGFMRMLLGIMCLISVVACATTYQPGSFQSPGVSFGSTRAVTGCLDIAIEAVSDAAARGPVAAITVANRCNAGVHLDFNAIKATGRLHDGQQIAMRAFDPNLEIKPALLGVRSVAREVIEFPATDDAWPLTLCLDFAAFDKKHTQVEPAALCVPVDGPVATVALAAGTPR